MKSVMDIEGNIRKHHEVIEDLIKRCDLNSEIIKTTLLNVQDAIDGINLLHKRLFAIEYMLEQEFIREGKDSGSYRKI